MSGSSAWICASASTPSRAVPPTRTPAKPPISSATTVRMSALSSTTSTVFLVSRRGPPGASEDTLAPAHRADLEPSARDVERHRAAALAADVLAHDAHARRLQGGARRLDVPLPHARARREGPPEDAGAPRELRDERPLRAPRAHLLQEERHGRLWGARAAGQERR